MSQGPEADAPVLMAKCVGATDRCHLGGPCPFCEPVWPLRYEDGRFAPYLLPDDDQPKEADDA